MDIKRIIRKIQKGDQSAFKQLVEHFQEYAFKLAFRIVCNEDDARDVVQDSFIKVWRTIKNYDVSVKFTTWLYKIVTNSAIDQYRKNTKRRTVSIDSVAYTPFDIDSDKTQQNLDNIEIAKLIAQLSDGLPDKQRVVFILRDIQGLDSQEVQEILELSETVVKSNLYHARKSLKGKLSKLMVLERRLA